MAKPLFYSIGAICLITASVISISCKNDSKQATLLRLEQLEFPDLEMAERVKRSVQCRYLVESGRKLGLEYFDHSGRMTLHQTFDLFGGSIHRYTYNKIGLPASEYTWACVSRKYKNAYFFDSLNSILYRIRYVLRTDSPTVPMIEHVFKYSFNAAGRQTELASIAFDGRVNRLVYQYHGKKLIGEREYIYALPGTLGATYLSEGLEAIATETRYYVSRLLDSVITIRSYRAPKGQSKELVLYEHGLKKKLCTLGIVMSYVYVDTPDHFKPDWAINLW